MERKLKAIIEDVKDFRKLVDDIKQLLDAIPDPPYTADDKKKIDELNAKLEEALNKGNDILKKFEELAKEYDDLEPCLPGEKDDLGKKILEAFEVFISQMKSLQEAIKDSKFYKSNGGTGPSNGNLNLAFNDADFEAVKARVTNSRV